MSTRKYTDEEVKFIVSEYEYSPSKETVDFLADKLGVTSRSIIGKLSKLGVYKKQPYTPKYATKPISKEELVAEIARHLDLDIEQLEGLTKSQKPALLYLVNQLDQREDGRIHASTYE